MSDFDFSHLAEAAVVKADQTRDYIFDDLKGSPALECLPATDENKGYRDERLARINRRRKSLRRGVNLTPALMVKARNEDRELFAAHCVKGWRNVKDKAGNAVPFSAEACLVFLRAVPDYLFDEFRGWIVEPTNFTDVADEDDDGDEESPTLGES